MTLMLSDKEMSPARSNCPSDRGMSKTALVAASPAVIPVGHCERIENGEKVFVRASCDLGENRPLSSGA